MATLPRYPFSGAATVAKEIAYRQKLLGTKDVAMEGFTLGSPTGLTQPINAGVAFITGLQVGDGNVAPDDASLSDEETNRIYIKRNGLIEVRDSGTPGAPTNSVLLWTITTSGGTIDTTTDNRGPLLPVFTKGISLDGNRVRDVADPVNATDGANKQWTEALVAQEVGGDSWEDPVLSVNDNTPPGSPSTGDRYIVGAAPTGAWSSNAKNIAEWDGSAWEFTAPSTAMVAYVEDVDEFYVYQTDNTWHRVVEGTSEATANTVVERDGSGRTKVANATDPEHAMNRQASDARYANVSGDTFNGPVVHQDDVDAHGEVHLSTTLQDLIAHWTLDQTHIHLGDQLIVNGDMEAFTGDELDNWDEVGAEVDTQEDNTTFQEGTSSVRCFFSSAGAADQGIEQVIAGLEDDRSYRVTAWVRTKIGGGGPDVDMRVHNTTDVITTAQETFTDGSQFVKKELTFYKVAGKAYKLQFLTATGPVSGDEFFVDDVQVREIYAYDLIDEDAAHKKPQRLRFVGQPSVGTSGGPKYPTAAGPLPGTVAITFDGVDDYLASDAADEDRYDIDDEDFYLEAWNDTAAPADGVLVAKKASAGVTAGYMLRVLGSGFVSLNIADGTNQATVTGAIDVGDDTWRHIIVSVDRDGDATIIVDGAVDTAGDVSNVTGSLSNGQQFTVGANGTGTVRYAGSIYGPRIGKRTVSVDEALARSQHDDNALEAIGLGGSRTDKFQVQFHGHAGPDKDNEFDLGAPDRRFRAIHHGLETQTADFTAQSGRQYFVNHATPATQAIAELPESPTAGDYVMFIGGDNTGGFRVKENATSQEAIVYGDQSTVGDGTGFINYSGNVKVDLVFNGTAWFVTVTQDETIDGIDLYTGSGGLNGKLLKAFATAGPIPALGQLLSDDNDAAGLPVHQYIANDIILTGPLALTHKTIVYCNSFDFNGQTVTLAQGSGLRSPSDPLIIYANKAIRGTGTVNGNGYANNTNSPNGSTKVVNVPALSDMIDLMVTPGTAGSGGVGGCGGGGSGASGGSSNNNNTQNGGGGGGIGGGGGNGGGSGNAGSGGSANNGGNGGNGVSNAGGGGGGGGNGGGGNINNGNNGGGGGGGFGGGGGGGSNGGGGGGTITLALTDVFYRSPQPSEYPIRLGGGGAGAGGGNATGGHGGGSGGVLAMFTDIYGATLTVSLNGADGNAKTGNGSAGGGGGGGGGIAVAVAAASNGNLTGNANGGAGGTGGANGGIGATGFIGILTP